MLPAMSPITKVLAYEAHVRRPDGTELEVLVDEDFEVTAVEPMRRP